MKKKTGSANAISIGTIILLLAIAAAPAALGADSRWTISLEGVSIDPDLAFTTDSGDGTPINATDERDTGFALAASYRFTRRMSVQLGYLQASPGVRVSSDLDGSRVSAVSDLSMRSTWAALKIHLTPDRIVDVYLSPTLVATSFGGLSYRVELPDGSEQSIGMSVGDDTGWGIGLGADLPLGDRWYATSSVRWLDTALEIEENSGEFADSLDFDSMVVGLGIGVRF